MDRRTTPVLLSITFLLMACRGGGGPTEQGLTGNIYRVSVDSSDLRVVNVHADLTISTDMLSMDWPAVGFLEKGWSTFVQDLKVHDASGRAIGILYKGKAKWVLRAVAMLGSPVAELRTIATSPRLDGPGQRLKALACLTLIRGYRSYMMLRTMIAGVPKSDWSRG